MRQFSVALLAVAGGLTAMFASPRPPAAAQPPSVAAVRPVDPGTVALPAEGASIGETRFSFR